MPGGWTCPACGTGNPEGTRFCGHCGQQAPTTGDGGGREGRSDRSAVGPVQGERRFVTALFADISGFTTLAENVDADLLCEIIAPIVSRLAAVAERYGGFVAKFAGDALLVVFGAPVAQEDHAVRSLHVALEMRNELAASTWTLPNEAKELQLHIGVNSGWVVSGTFGGEHPDYSVLGEAVNLAQRLESVAPPGAIYVGQATADLVKRRFELVAVGQLELKGMARPVRAWELVGTLNADEGIPRWAGADRFVGRDHELAKASSVLGALLQGHGDVVAITGEAGIGKSRFVQELQRRHRDVRWLEARCLSYMTSVAYGPFVDLVRREFGITQSESSLGAAARIAEALAAVGLSAAVPYFAALAGVASEMDAVERPPMAPAAFRIGLHQAITDWVRVLAQTRPVVVVIEDTHWADASTLELAADLRRLVNDSPVDVWFTGRPEAEPVVAAIVDGRRDEVWIGLEALAGVEVRALVTKILGEDAPDDFIGVIAERTGGNPFFAEEMVRSLIDTGGLERNGVWKLRADWDEASVPPTVEGVLAARMDRLPRPAAAVLQVAAIIGRRVQVSLLEAVAAGVADIDFAVRHLVDQAFLERLPPEPEEAVAFRHALVLEVAYLRQLRRRRRELHRKVAEAGESLYGAGDDVIEFLAGHLYRAEVVPQAIHYLLRAGERAKRLFANREAIDHLSRGLELVPLLHDPAEEARHELELRAALASPLIAVRGHGSDEVGALCAQVSKLCHQVGNRPELFPILFALVGFHLIRGEFEEAASAGKALMSVAEASEDRPRLLVATFAHGMTLYCRGELESAQRHLQRGIGLHRPAEDAALRLQYVFDPGIGCHRVLALVLWLTGHPESAVDENGRALRLAREQPDPYGLGAVLLYGAVLHQYRREADVTLRYADEALAVSAEHGFPLWSFWASILRDWALVERARTGEPEEPATAVERLANDVSAYERAGFTLFLPYCLGLLAEAYGRVRRTADGIACLGRAMTLAERSGERVWEAELHRVRGELVLADSADVAEAERCFRRALAIAGGQGAVSLRLRAAASLAHLLHGLDRSDEAIAVLEPAVADVREGDETSERRQAVDVLAVIAGAASRRKEAWHDANPTPP